MLNRRDFLTRLTALSAGALLPIPALARMTKKNPDGRKVLIAGSETAGHFPTYVEGALSSAERAVEGVAHCLEREFVLA